MEDCKQEFISCCNPTDKQVMFKVGDWVRHIESNNIYKINGFSIHGQTKGFIQIHDEYHLVPQSECELWQPKEGEWCWFWDKKKKITHLV